jgi:hypothetical protein
MRILIQIQGFDDQKCKKITAEKITIFSFEIAIYLPVSLGLLEGGPKL